MKTTGWAIVIVAALALSVAAMAQEIKGKAGEFFNQGVAAIQAGQLDKALSHFEEAKKVAEGDVDPILIAGQIAQIYAAQGRYDEAKAYLTVQADKSGKSGYKVELARLILKSDPSGAPSAVDILKDVTAREPRNVEAWIESGRALARSGDCSKAIAAYEQVTRHLARKDLRAHYGLAEAFILAGLFGRARNTMTAALAINPEAPESYVWLGRAYDRDRSQIGYLESAIQQYERAYQLDRSRAMYLGHALFDQLMGDTHAIVKASGKKRLEKHAGDSVAFWFEGLIKELKGDLAGALADHTRAIAANPENVYAHFALAHIYAGVPTPGFGPLFGPRVESWRYVPQRNLRKANQSVAAIKLIDPTFPYLSTLNAMVQEKLAAEYPSQPSTPDADTVQRMNKMAEYYQHLQKTR